MSNEWHTDDVEAFMERSPTHPGSLFLKRRGISAENAVALNLMPYLVTLPSLPRKLYGPRQHKTTSKEKSEDTKARNKEHGRLTRVRRFTFKQCEKAVTTHMPLPRMALVPPPPLPLPRMLPPSPSPLSLLPPLPSPEAADADPFLFACDASDAVLGPFSMSSPSSFSSFGCSSFSSGICDDYEYAGAASHLTLPECQSLTPLSIGDM